jgi:ParB family transcriptional regulator, chromosome partitioning protein
LAADASINYNTDSMAELAVFPKGGKPPASITALADAVESDGGAALAAFQEPIERHWHLFALLPIDKVKPTPFQRDLSPAHMKRLMDVMKRLGRYTEPIVAVRIDGEYWTPNGNHRRAAAAKLGARTIPVIMIPEPDVAYQILALNTEKTHTLRDKALEVIRMYRARLEHHPRAAEKDFAFEFERAHFITLGLLYEANPRFSGGAYAPLLSRIDTFMTKPMRDAMEEREQRASQLRHADEIVAELVAKAKKRGLSHPYLKNFIVCAMQSAHAGEKNAAELQVGTIESDKGARGIRRGQNQLRSGAQRGADGRRGRGRRTELTAAV